MVALYSGDQGRSGRLVISSNDRSLRSNSNPKEAFVRLQLEQSKDYETQGIMNVKILRT